jgi:hypothetical protein
MHHHSDVGSSVDMAFADPRQIHREHQITVDDEKVLGQQIQRLQKSSCISQRFFFREDPNPEAKLRAIPNEIKDFLGKVTGKDGCFTYPRTHSQFQLVLEHRLAANGNQRFRQIPNDGGQTSAGSTCNNDKVVKLWG